MVPCDVRCLRAEVAAVGALARLQLAAMRAGCRICLCNASPELLELIALIGLEEALPADEDRRASR